jgi:transcriptional regulator with XRE-family HTH domain
MEFHERLQKVAREKKIDQKDIADGLNIFPATVNRWWKGKVMPRGKSLRSLADYLSCNIEWLEKGTGDIFPPPPPLGTAENQNFLRKRREQIVDETSAKLSRDRFKMQCLGFFDELFDFVGDCYGEDRDAVNDFLAEVYTSHANYRVWREEKKEERRNYDDAFRQAKIAENE